MKNKLLISLLFSGILFAQTCQAASILDIDAGGASSGEELTLSDSTVNDFSLTKHGFVPKGTSTAGRFLKGDATWGTPLGGGDVVGPASAANDRVVFFDGLSGKLVKDSGLLLSGSNTGDQTAIPNSNLATMVTKTYKGRTAGTTGTPEDVAVATLKTDLVLTKGDVGLGNVDNTSDANKPVSTSQQTALDLKAPSINPLFTGTLKAATGYPLIQPITRDRRRFIENSDGLSSSAWAYNTPQQSIEVTGTRSSDTVFTRTSGTWVASALVGQYVFSFASSVPDTGVWLPITANTTTTVTISGTLNATGTSVYTCPWNPINATYAHGQGATAFQGGIFDSASVWLVPLSSSNLVKVNPATGEMITYAHGQGAGAFRGGVFDGESIWLVPYSSSNLVKVNPATGVMTAYAHGQGVTAFVGGVFDGESIWLIPYSSSNLVKVNPATGAMTTYAHGQGATAFQGGVFDGESLWLVPLTSSNLVKVNPVTGAMTAYAHGQGAGAFVGGVFDGESIWLVPSGSSNLVKVNPVTGAMTAYAHGQGASAFRGGVFDGESIWLIPYSSSNLVKVNPATGAMTTYAHGQGATAFGGGVFDGESLWLVPSSSSNLVKVRVPRAGVKSSTGFINVGTYSTPYTATTLAPSGATMLNSGISTGTGDVKQASTILFKGSGWTGSAAQIVEHAIVSDARNDGNPTFRILKREGGSGAWTQILGIDENGSFLSVLKYATFNILEVLTQGAVLQNTAASTSSSDQYSPYLTMLGTGWKTNATAGSQLMSWGAGVAPEQGAANPIGVYKTFFGTNASVPVESNELYRLEWGDRRGVVFNEQGADQDFRIESDTVTEAFVVDGATGNVGVGASVPSAQLHTTGTVRFQNFGAGAATFDASGNVSSASDERLKNIDGNFTPGLNQVLGLLPILYHWNDLSGLDKDNQYTGFSAQNVRKYLPEAVSIDSGGYYNLQDRVIIATLVNAIKELSVEVDTMRAELGLAKVDRKIMDRTEDKLSVTKSKVACLKKQCGLDEIVTENKIITEKEIVLVDGVEVEKEVEKIKTVLKEGIVEKEGKYYRVETDEEALFRYKAISQE